MTRTAVETVFTRASSGAELIERLIRAASGSLDAALYRFNNPCLAKALEEAARRGVRVRLVLDLDKYNETATTRELLSKCRIPFRLLSGRAGPGSKMHHKFAILDDELVITGSYNWTLESENQNYENVLVLRGPEQVDPYRREFESLWSAAPEACRSQSVEA